MKEILMGDEAVGLGAIHSGIKTACGYPGTPSTEIYEYIIDYVEKHHAPIHAIWSANEKVAYEEALGASFAGCRTIVTMKHVGLNVAADPFMNSAMTGVNGGLIVAVADDPSMHSSQNEQDSRYYAHFAMIPCFEPSNQQEAYDLTREAYEISERFQLPVMMRMVTRLAHSRSTVQLRDPRPFVEPKPVSNDFTQWTLLPVNARKRYKNLLQIQADLLAYAEQSPFNIMHLTENRKIGVITTGIAHNYLLEYLQQMNETISFLKINVYPAPIAKIRQFFDAVEEVLVLEEGFPFLEEKLRAILPHSYKIHGRMDGTISRDGELSPDSVRKAFGKPSKEHAQLPNVEMPPRPPALCKGCPHADIYQALQQVMQQYPQGRVFSDIGCYTLGALPPYNMGTTCVDMGASISMAKGAADCGIGPCVATIGDSTFIHSGMTPLIGAARENSNIKVIILDNATVAMTGGQTTMATGEILDRVILGLGVDKAHFKELSPLPKNFETNVAILKEEFAYKGLSVLVCRRECIQTAKHKVKKAE